MNVHGAPFAVNSPVLSCIGQDSVVCLNNGRFAQIMKTGNDIMQYFPVFPTPDDIPTHPPLQTLMFGFQRSMWMTAMTFLDRITHTTYVDAVCCYRPSSVVCRSKTAQPIIMPFGL